MDHPLVALFADLIRGIYPPADGLTEVMPRPEGAVAAVLAFTAHHIVAADVDPSWVADLCPTGDLLAPVSPPFLLALSERLGSHPGAFDLVLCTTGEAGEPEVPLLTLDPGHVHPRVARAHRYRKDVRVYQTPGGEGLLIVGQGLAGRWEAAFEVAPEHRNRGLGRALVCASRRLIEPGEGLFMQVAAGNVASLRAILATGFRPVYAEILFPERESAGPM